MEETVATGRDEVLFRYHLQPVGDGVEEPDEAEAEDVGPVGPDAVLHHSALLALDPGQKPRHVHDEADDKEDLDQMDERLDDHSAASVTATPTGSPSAPRVSYDSPP